MHYTMVDNIHQKLAKLANLQMMTSVTDTVCNSVYMHFEEKFNIAQQFK